MKIMTLILLLFSIGINAKEYTVKKRKLSLKVSFDISSEYEAKLKFLNTPLLIWNKSLKHHGPSIGLFPMQKLPKHALSTKAINSNLSSFKKEKEANLKTLKATDITFGKLNLKSDRAIYTYRYVLPGKVSVYSTEVLMKCSGKGLRVKSVVKKADYEKFKPMIDGFFSSVKCLKN